MNQSVNKCSSTSTCIAVLINRWPILVFSSITGRLPDGCLVFSSIVGQLPRASFCSVVLQDGWPRLACVSSITGWMA